MRALVVYKKSNYELYAAAPRDRRFLSLQAQQHPFIHTMYVSHQENQRTLAAVQAAFEAVDMPYTCVYRGELRSTDGYDLLCSVGGDGTFLEVARYTDKLPVLGVNSDPERSTAYFCAADRHSIEASLRSLLDGSLSLVSLARLQVTLNDQTLPVSALNDILVAHTNPASTTSYVLRLGDIEESQKSSGVWIATAAGSTAAIRSAGGRIMPLRSQQLQYLVREPYHADGQPYRLLKGLVTPETPLELISKIRRGRIFVDGPHLHYALELGDVMTVSTNAAPLQVLGLDRRRRRRF